MSTIVILGAGVAGFGASHHLAGKGVKTVVFDKNHYHGGHAASFQPAPGWIFDDGPHISFTRDSRIQSLFAESVGDRFERLRARANNYWRGHWIKHPACCNLKGLPQPLVDRVIQEIGELGESSPGPIRHYADWLVAGYGRTYAEAFPMRYGKKFHTTEASNMTTDWCGGRLYRPTPEEVQRGAETDATPDVHYIDHFRYPSFGGFVSYLERFRRATDVRLGCEIVGIDFRSNLLRFSDGHTLRYEGLVSSIPLPALIRLLPEAPPEVREAADRLAWTQSVIVNLGIDRADLSSAHWSYFYDEEIEFVRLSFPHMFSPHVVPDGCGSIQAELYFSRKYRPLTRHPSEFIPSVIADLRKCGLLTEADRILFSEARFVPWAQIIYDHDRASSLDVVHGFLEEAGIAFCGRYGEWGYHWTDESFKSGEAAAEKVLRRVPVNGAASRLAQPTAQE